jgi:Protein of unknown function (DUF2877)
VGVEFQEFHDCDLLTPVAQMQALSVGHALDVYSAGLGRIHSVFAQALNVEIRGDMWTLLGAERTDLPFSIRVASMDFNSLGLCRGDPVNVRAGFIGIGPRSTRIVVDCRAAPRWTPAREDMPASGLGKRLDVVSAVASPLAWHDSTRMAYAVVSTLGNPNALDDVVSGVVGCGPGCTPAGDDVLIGIVAVLGSPHSGARGSAALHSLRRSLHPLLPRTTDISAHLLRQAADGLVGRAVHELVCASIGNAGTSLLREAVNRVVDSGATSGADMCMGLLASARSFLLDLDEREAA